MHAQRLTYQLDQLARGNWCVFTLAELTDLGVTKMGVETMVARSQLHRIHRGVYAFGRSEVSWQGRYLAAQHLGGEGAYLTRGSGLAVMGLWRPYTREIHVCTTRARRSRDGVVIHRTTRPPEADELRRRGPLRFAALPRLLLELAPASNQRQLTGLITRAARRELLDHGLMRAVLARYAGSPGAALLTRAYAGYIPVPEGKSRLEERWDHAAAARPWIPAPQRNVIVRAGGIAWEIDRFWPEHRVAVEIDGRNYHQALADRAKDELKRAKLLTEGISVLHISDWRIDYDIDDALDDLEKIIGIHRL